jgi:hypothetical protein
MSDQPTQFRPLTQIISPSELVISPWFVGPVVRTVRMDPGEPPNRANQEEIEAFSPHDCDDDGK